MRGISSFSIQNPKEIARHLFLLVKNECLLSAYFGTNNECYITTLLDINEKNNTVVVDYGPKEDLNQHILSTGKVIFDTNYNGFKVSFTGTTLKKITHKGAPAFSMPMPKLIFWMQRREYYRVKVPISKSAYCQLILEDREPVNLKLHDISLSGFAMFNGSREISGLLIPGKSLEQCKLILPSSGGGVISFEICNKYIINPDELQKTQKLGCKFNKLASPVEADIQSFMLRIQREYLQK